jgi:hypothetical protein
VPAFLPAMLAEDRMRAGWSVEQAARRLGASSAVYRELEAGTQPPAGETWGPDLHDVRLAVRNGVMTQPLDCC